MQYFLQFGRFLEYGDVVVAEPSDGAVTLTTGKCLLITDSMDGD
jgi:hypothetical protein